MKQVICTILNYILNMLTTTSVICCTSVQFKTLLAAELYSGSSIYIFFIIFRLLENTKRVRYLLLHAQPSFLKVGRDCERSPRSTTTDL